MKIKSPKKASRVKITALVLTGILTLALIGYGLYTLLSRPQVASEVPTEPADNINYNQASNEDKQETIDHKQDLANESGNGSQAPTVTSADITVSITRAGQSAAGQPVKVRSFVDGISSGSCTLTFTKSGQTTVTKSVDITFEATTAYCNTDIELSKFNTGGDWQLSVQAQKDNVLSQPATQTVNISK
jgi:hypothetical protein